MPISTPARISVLRLVASQAAIALENTRLYRDLAEREAKIRRLVDANIIGIMIWSLDGQVLEANDAFLHIVGYERADLLAVLESKYAGQVPEEYLEIIRKQETFSLLETWFKAALARDKVADFLAEMRH